MDVKRKGDPSSVVVSDVTLEVAVEYWIADEGFHEPSRSNSTDPDYSCGYIKKKMSFSVVKGVFKIVDQFSM